MRSKLDIPGNDTIYVNWAFIAHAVLTLILTAIFVYVIIVRTQ